MASSPTKFVHEPLVTSRPTIRVLRLTNFSLLKDIRCVLKHIDLEDDAYVCLSYTWGKPLSAHTIFINGQPFQVRESLWQFLRRAQEQQIEDWLWIDAICNNQEDVAERNHQVRLMGEVYSKAKHVLVFPHEAHWNMELVGYINRVWKRPVLNRLICRLVDRFRKALLLWLWGRFQYHEYWTRMWILQEIVLAKKALLMLRTSKQDLLHFDHGLYYVHQIRSTPAEDLVSLCWYSKTYSRNLVGLIQNTFEFNCQNPHDRIYALLGMLPKEVASRIPVDYNREWSLVVFDALMEVCRHDGRICAQSVSDILISLRYLPSTLCGKCAKLPKYDSTSSDGCIGTPISELVTDDQDMFLIAGSLAIPTWSGIQLNRKPIERWQIPCTQCHVSTAPMNSWLILSRPLENVLCAKIQHEGFVPYLWQHQTWQKQLGCE